MCMYSGDPKVSHTIHFLRQAGLAVAVVWMGMGGWVRGCGVCTAEACQM